MPSKKSKQSPNPLRPLKVVRDCSEAVLVSTAADLAREFKLGDRVILEGPMGSGKTTFARALLLSLGIRQPPEGSPSFAIAHEYDAPVGGVVHIDFYRIKSGAEIDDAGIPSYYWERELIVISEWLSLWPEFDAQVRKSGRVWQIRLEFSATGAADQRDLEIAVQEDSL